MGIYVLVIWAAWNTFVFALYGVDKSRAIHNKWRISEATLIASAFFAGALGAFLGMSFFRHKTKRLKFKILIPMALISNAVLFTIYWLYMF